MNKKFIISAIAIIALGILFAYLLFIYQQQGAGERAQPSATSTAPTVSQTIDVAREAIVQKNPSLCDRLETESEQTACEAYTIIADAQAALDPAPCSKIKDSYWLTNCKDQVITYKAIAAQDPNICEQMIVKERIPSCKKAVQP